MNIATTLLEIERIQQRLTLALPKRLRLIFKHIDLLQNRSALIVGPRGVGKTTLLLHSAKNQAVLYVSADHPITGNWTLWDIASYAFENGYDGIAIDEVHYSKDWSQHLKSIYDSYPDKKIWASDSSSLVLREGLSDLSRRFPRIPVPILSLREFVYFQTEKIFEPFNIFVSSENCESIVKTVDINALLRQYFQFGCRPFYLENSYQERVVNIIEKTIFSDVPFLLPQFTQQYLRIMNAIIGYLALSKIPTLNIESLSNEWSIGKEKLYDLLNALEHVGLINIVRYESDRRASGKGAKILLSDPSFYHALGGELGNIRESFVVANAKNTNQTIFASKKESTGDFVLSGKLVEVGGKNKKIKHADFVLRDDFELPVRNALPLWTLGFSY